MDTHPLLLECITQGLQGNFKTRRSKNIELEDIIKRLGDIGQLNLLNGFISKGMWQIQHRYYRERGSCKQDRTRGKKLVGGLIEFSLSKWNKLNSLDHNKTAHGLK